MELRPYQTEVIQQIYTAWHSGARNVIVQLATGAGKTVIFSKIIADNPGASIAIAHRVELVSQISLTLARNGVRHNIVAQKQSIRDIVSLQMSELRRSYYDPHAHVIVAGIDTLIRLPVTTAWFQRITLVVQDEGHHPLLKNKWGAAAALFPNARGLYPTATPVRADGKGLGRHADGIADALVIGMSMRDLINLGYLCDYRIFAPPSDVDLSQVPISASGDFSPPKLRAATHRSHIVGDVVQHYLKIAPGKLGVTFAVDIEAATEIAAAFRSAGVSAEVVSSKTPDLLRANIMQRFKNREILQLVNVDLLGEGVDVPALEVVSFCRATASFGLFSQQFGRALRPMPGKSHAIIIDHVSNVARHGLPDAPRTWSLDRRDKRRSARPDSIPLKTCIACFGVYARVKRNCPYCGFYTEPTSRSAPEFVDGDLFELDPNVLARLRGEIERIDGAPRVPKDLPSHAVQAIGKRHRQRQQAQIELRESIALWAGYHKLANKTDSEIYREFYHAYGTDILTAQTLNANEASTLRFKITNDIDTMDNKGQK
jgi:superfamily II DNA or RNA helicase